MAPRKTRTSRNKAKKAAKRRTRVKNRAEPRKDVKPAAKATRKTKTARAAGGVSTAPAAPGPKPTQPRVKAPVPSLPLPGIGRRGRRRPAAQPQPRRAPKPTRKTGSSPYDTDLDRNPANYQPLTPLSFLKRAAKVHAEVTAIVHGRQRMNYAEFYARSCRLGSALAQR